MTTPGALLRDIATELGKQQILRAEIKAHEDAVGRLADELRGSEHEVELLRAELSEQGKAA